MAGDADEIDELLAMLVDDERDGTVRRDPAPTEQSPGYQAPSAPPPGPASQAAPPATPSGYAGPGATSPPQPDRYQAGQPAQGQSGGHQDYQGQTYAAPRQPQGTGPQVGAPVAPGRQPGVPAAAVGAPVLGATQAPSAGRPSRRRRGLLLVLLVSGAVNLVALVLVLVWWTGRDSETAAELDESAEATSTSSTETASQASEPDTTATSAAAPTTTSDGEMLSVASTPENPTGAVQYAVFEDGQIHLRGFVRSEEIAEQHVAGGEAILGEGNVINEYEIDPSAPAEVDEYPIYLADVILFGFNSTELDPAFFPLLDTTPLFLQQNPAATITVIARTDSVGSEEINLEIAEKRAQAVIDYWVAQGVDPSRLTADPRGEADASGAEDDETAAYDRRVEIVLQNLLE